MKRMIEAYPAHFASWLASEARFVRSLDKELKSQHLFADGLLEIILNGILALLHIEFQTYDDPEMQVRLLEYNVLASRQYGHCPVYSYVIYLRRTAGVAESPFVREFPTGQVIHQFHYQVIKLWEVPAELILQLGMVGLLPLLTLTEGGKKPEVVREMIDRLAAEREMDLLAIARVVGGLVFTKEAEREWFRKRFSMFQDILRESWVYQEIGEEFLEKGFEKGLEKGLEQGLEQGLELGREEERQRRLQGQRELLMSYMQVRFPEITALAKQQTNSITDPEVLQNVIIKLLAAQSLDEAKQILFGVDKSEKKH